MSEKSPFDSSPRGIVRAESSVDNGALNMNEKEVAFKPSIHGASKEGKRERAFELSLPALVIGMDTLENRFREKTQITSISSEEATVWLRSLREGEGIISVITRAEVLSGGTEAESAIKTF